MPMDSIILPSVNFFLTISLHLKYSMSLGRKFFYWEIGDVRSKTIKKHYSGRQMIAIRVNFKNCGGQRSKKS